MAESDDDYKLSWRNLPLGDPLVEAKLSDGFAIMLHRDDCRSFQRRNRHYRPYRDANGWYIRTGKRAVVKEYLTICEVTYDHGEPLLFQFRTKEGLPLHRKARRETAKRVIERKIYPRSLRKMLDLLPRAGMNEYELKTGVVVATDGGRNPPTGNGNDHAIMIVRPIDSRRNDCIGIGFRTNSDGGVWHMGYYSPARCRLISLHLLQAAAEMEKAEPTSLDVDTPPPHEEHKP